MAARGSAGLAADGRESDFCDSCLTIYAPICFILTIILTLVWLTFFVGWAAVAEFVFDSVEDSEKKHEQALIINSALIFVVVTALPSPMLLMILNGFFFGLWVGFCLSFVSEMIGATLSLILARNCLRTRIRGYLTRNRKTWEVVLMCEEDPSGKFLVLLRMLSIPAWVKNYGIAILDIPAYRFLLVAVPAECFYSGLFAYIGSKAYVISDRLRKGDTGAVWKVFNGAELIVVGVTAAVGVAILVMGYLEYQKRKARLEGKTDEGEGRRGSEKTPLLRP